MLWQLSYKIWKGEPRAIYHSYQIQAGNGHYTCSFESTGYGIKTGPKSLKF